MIKEQDKQKKDKNLQDDWLPDQERSVESTSEELPEYGGDIKEKETIKKERTDEKDDISPSEYSVKTS